VVNGINYEKRAEPTIDGKTGDIYLDAIEWDVQRREDVMNGGV
jgi:hypothetical protein